jgi:uncharacterized membrane-anchored protein
MENCQNCGRPIGNLETPHVFQEHIVCPTCYERLKPTIAYASPAPAERSPHTQTVEMTDKNWKFKQLMGSVILMPSLFVLIVGILSTKAAQNPTPAGMVALVGGAVGLVAGLGLYCYGRFGGWWNHG